MGLLGSSLKASRRHLTNSNDHTTQGLEVGNRRRNETDDLLRMSKF